MRVHLVVTGVSVGVSAFCLWLLFATAGAVDPLPREPIKPPDPRIAELEAEVAALKSRVVGLMDLAHRCGFGGEIPVPADCIKDPWLPHVVSYSKAELDH